MSAPDPFTLLDRYMQFLIPDGFARILGQQSVNVNILTVKKYWEDPRSALEWGNPTINVVMDRSNKPVAPWYAFEVSNIMVGGMPMSVYYWGQATGTETVITRVGFWKLFFAGDLRQNIRNRATRIFPRVTEIPSFNI